MKNKMCSVGFEGEILEKRSREFLEVSFNNFNKSFLFVYFTHKK